MDGWMDGWMDGMMDGQGSSIYYPKILFEGV